MSAYDYKISEQFMENGKPEEYAGGVINYYNGNCLHRLDGPAIIDPTRNYEEYRIRGEYIAPSKYWNDKRVGQYFAANKMLEIWLEEEDGEDDQ